MPSAKPALRPYRRGSAHGGPLARRVPRTRGLCASSRHFGCEIKAQLRARVWWQATGHLRKDGAAKHRADRVPRGSSWPRAPRRENPVWQCAILLLLP